MNTTISIPEDLRDRIKEFGEKGDTYADIIEKLYRSARERLLHDLLMDEKGTVPVRMALAEAKKEYGKSHHH
ncbi:MAG: hypothetical protein ACOCWQ_04730 [Nanoarchaeota archaeon]